MNKLNSEYYLHIFLLFILIISAINWGLFAFGYNAVEMLSKFVDELTGQEIMLDKIIYVFIAIIAIIYMLKRDNWLPFLGKTIISHQLFDVHYPHNYDTIIKIKTCPNAKILYWSAYPSEKPTNVDKAYGDYGNCGVTLADDAGVAECRVIKGSDYKINGVVIDRHIHFRILDPKSQSVIGPVHSLYY